MFSDAQWSEKARAIKALCLQLPDIMEEQKMIANVF